VLIVVINAPFHLFQEATNPFTVVIALDKTNQMILVEIDHLETIEVQDIPETIEVQEISETIEVQEISETMTERKQL
jgi:hypothetical protein